MSGSRVGEKAGKVKTNLKPSRQNTCEGCLPACLLMLINKKVTFSTELGLIVGGFKRYRESYAPGIIKEFVSKYNKRVKVYVHSKYFFKKLRWLADFNIQFEHHKINLELMNRLDVPFIAHVDDRILRRSVHWPHFVIVERKHKNKFVLIDPWDGKRKFLNENKLMYGVLSLKNYLKYCPLLIIVERE